MTLEHRVMTRNAGAGAHYLKRGDDGAVSWVRDYKQATTWTWPSDAEGAMREAQAQHPAWSFRLVRLHDDFWKKSKAKKAKPSAKLATGAS